MTTPPERSFDNETADNPWPSLGWIIFAAALAITALLLAPVPA